MTEKTVERVCEGCGIVRELKLKSALKPLCFKCAMAKRRTSRNLLPNKVTLEHYYLDCKYSMTRIGILYNVGPGIVQAKLKELGIPSRTIQEGQLLRGDSNKGKNNPGYKNGRTQNGKDGYVFILLPDHPKAHQGYVREHLLVWEEANKVPLPDGWVIHHLNGIKNDNRIENLGAMPKNKHALVIPVIQQRIRELENILHQRTGQRSCNICGDSPEFMIHKQDSVKHSIFCFACLKIRYPKIAELIQQYLNEWHRPASERKYLINF